MDMPHARSGSPRPIAQRVTFSELTKDKPSPPRSVIGSSEGPMALFIDDLRPRRGCQPGGDCSVRPSAWPELTVDQDTRSKKPRVHGAGLATTPFRTDPRQGSLTGLVRGPAFVVYCFSQARPRGWRGWSHDLPLQVGNIVCGDAHQLPTLLASIVQETNVLIPARSFVELDRAVFPSRHCRFLHG